MNHLDSLRAFDAAATAGSFAGGGRALGSSRDQVSKLVMALERRLGVGLFKRSTRAVTLADLGANHLERVRRALAELDAADASIRAADTRPVGLLSVHAPLSWGLAVLSPLCGEFRTVFPEVKIDLTLDDRHRDPMPGGVDVMVRIAARFDGTAAVERLGEVRRALYAAPSCLARHPAPAAPEDLARHDCVHYAQLASGAQWVLEVGQEVRQVRVDGGFSCNAGIGVLASVVAGEGIGILPDFLVQGPLDRGELVEVLPAWRPPMLQVHALAPPTMWQAPKVRAHLTFLKKRLAARCDQTWAE